MSDLVIVTPTNCEKLFSQLRMLVELDDYRSSLKNMGYNPESLQLKPKDGEDQLDFCDINADGRDVPARIINVTSHGGGYNFSLIFDELKRNEAVTLGVTSLKNVTFPDNIRFSFEIDVSTDEEPSPRLEGEIADGSVVCFCTGH